MSETVKTRAQPVKNKEISMRTKIGKEMSLPKGQASELRKKPGMSNVGKYKNIAKSNFAGPDGTFPINTLARARNALSRAHFASNPSAIRKKVEAKYPQLKKDKK